MEAVSQDVSEVMLAEESAPFEFGDLELDVSKFGARKLTAVEDEEELVSFACCRGPVDHEWPADAAIQAQLLRNLSDAGLSGRLAGFDVSTRDVPQLLVGWLYKEHLARIVMEQRSGGDSGLRDFEALVTGHGSTLWGRPRTQLDHPEAFCQAGQVERRFAALLADPGLD